MWAIFNIFIKLVTILLLFYVLGFGLKAHEIFAPYPGTEPLPPTLEDKVLITGPPGKSLFAYHFSARFAAFVLFCHLFM